jgi:hypothetical protein
MLVARDDRISVILRVTRFSVAKIFAESESEVRMVDISDVKVV